MPGTPHNSLTSRRQFLWSSGGGLGGIALAQMLSDAGWLAPKSAQAATPAPAGLHHAPKAKRVMQLFMSGAASLSSILSASGS